MPEGTGVKQRGNHMDRRSFVIGTAASAAALAAPPALAQEGYPAHAITVISPFPPGGVSDTITRPLDAALEKVFKQPVVLENKVGAAGAVGAQFAAAAKPDGYTLLSHIVSISGFAAVDKLFGRTPKFTNDNFIPIARIIADPIVMIANVDTPYKTLKDLVADAKANPNKVIYSSSGLYGASHIPTALFAKSAGNLQMRHLPTNGGGPAVTAVLGGNVNFFMSPTSIALSHIRSGKVRALAVSSAQRVKVLPDVPTFKELGYDLEYYFWVGIFAPKGVPAPIIATLRDGFNKAAHSKEFLDTLANLGQELAYMDQPEFAKFWEADAKRQEDAINSIGRVQG
jgi:tripartite-type tricarboxylate transporter receptor subunit TctC